MTVVLCALSLSLSLRLYLSLLHANAKQKQHHLQRTEWKKTEQLRIISTNSASILEQANKDEVHTQRARVLRITFSTSNNFCGLSHCFCHENNCLNMSECTMHMLQLQFWNGWTGMHSAGRCFYSRWWSEQIAIECINLLIIDEYFFR